MDRFRLLCRRVHTWRTGWEVMSIWYTFAPACGLIAAIGLWAGLSKDKQSQQKFHFVLP